MYRIGICDDDIDFGCQIEEYLKEYAEEENVDLETEVFISGEECLDFLTKTPMLDLLFLDIRFGQSIDGVQVGRILRSDIANEVIQIVYVSADERYAMQLFRNRPIDFLIKPVGKDEIKRVMREYQRIFGDHKRFFEYRIGKAVYCIADCEIIYFQCSGKKIKIVTAKDEKEFYGTMSYVEKRTERDKFWCIHKSFIVNTAYISEFKRDEVVTVNGDILPISRAYRKKIQDNLLKMNEVKRKCR